MYKDGLPIGKRNREPAGYAYSDGRAHSTVNHLHLRTTTIDIGRIGSGRKLCGQYRSLHSRFRLHHCIDPLQRSTRTGLLDPALGG
jgi:hypothetical protein